MHANRAEDRTQIRLHPLLVLCDVWSIANETESIVAVVDLLFTSVSAVPSPATHEITGLIRFSR